MSEAATKLLEQLLALPEGERLQIADRLWESLGDEARQGVVDDLADDPEFQAELRRRLQEVTNHPEKLIPWEQAREKLQAELERRRAARRNGGAA